MMDCSIIWRGSGLECTDPENIETNENVKKSLA